MNYGFLIDNRSCIGCHACSTACKSENEVPLGVYRTWVKQVEVGAFGDARRHFQVTRCNHCAKPPCVTICPVTAMYKRPDGIVEFDPDACIGCKACLQACPYDAIYIDPDSGTAAKCHYCSHRTDLGLEPACVVVCPTQAIVAGDLSDPNSRIRQLMAEHPTTVRRPEQNTSPKLFYIDAHAVTLDPLAAPAPGNMMFTELIDQRAGMRAGGLPRPAEEPTMLSAGSMAGGLTRLTYNAQHKVPWHWQVPAYLVTKAIAAGLFMIMVAVWGMGWGPFDRGVAILGNIVVLTFLTITVGLLVMDLERPERFLRILTRPQWKSWLTRGAFILVGFSAVSAVWLAVEIATQREWLAEGMAAAVRGPLMLVGFPLALLTAIYTAFLFAQCEGRDLWQSKLMPWHMGVQAVMAGAALPFMAVPFETSMVRGSIPDSVFYVFPVAVLADLIFRLREVLGDHVTHHIQRATDMIRFGPERSGWRISVVFSSIAVIVPIVSSELGSRLIGYYRQVSCEPSTPDCLISLYQFSRWEEFAFWWGFVLSPILAIIGLFLYERAIVNAAQELPNA